jgi:hypothetical protein
MGWIREEKRMSEWIVSDVDLGCDGEYFSYQEIVRCKDCKYFHKNVWGSDIGIGRPYDCLIVGHCGCDFWGRKEDGNMTQTSEDAFCSFGERREANEID